MKPVPDLAIGDIMQLNPDPDVTRNAMFCACMFVVTEPRSWGAQGYVQGLGENGKPAGQAYYRANWEEMEPTGGRAEWMPGRGDDENEVPREKPTSILVSVDDLRKLQTQVEHNTARIQDITKREK